MPKLTIEDILKKKQNKEKIVMLTCYDYSFAKILDEAGLDIILVGDSLANVVLGLEETRKISFQEMLNHTKAVARGAENSLVIADMPYVAYQKNPDRSVHYASKFISAGAEGVKIEWFFSNKDTPDSTVEGKECIKVVRNLVKNGISVMGHIGLTPQTVKDLGGYKIQGKTKEAAIKLINQAKILEEEGVFSIVLECIPYQLASVITDRLKIPTIGIGAGVFCDGQVLVLYDFLGLYKKIRPKFVRVYKDLFEEIKSVSGSFVADVKRGNFPAQNESFSMKEEEWDKVKDVGILKL